ncbi:MAG: hypothetical protein NVS3B18_10360 [Candidatus Dormibacteria bacterium]
MKNASSGTTSFAYLSSQESSINTAGAAAKYILAWVAAGRPAAIDASALLTQLNTPTSSGGYLTAAGTFHNANATIETANAYSQSLAILADVAAQHPLPANATSWLTCAQLPDGGFGYVVNDATTTPPAFCGDASSDTNDTGIILQALGAAGITSANTAAATYLHGAQQGDGGFGFTGSGPSDPDSDAVVIQGLVAIGQDPSTWTRGGANPISNLETFADPKGTGGYIFPGKTAPDAFTTSGIPQALALRPYAAATSFTPGRTPTTTAATPTPTATPTAMSTTTPGVPVPATGVNGGPGTRLPLAALLLLLGAGTLGVAALGGRGSTVP